MVGGSGLTEEMVARLKGPSVCLHPSTSNKFGAERAGVSGAVAPEPLRGSQGRAKGWRSCFLEEGEATVEKQDCVGVCALKCLC